MASSAGDTASWIDVLGPVADACGVDLEDVEVTAAGRRTRIRVLIDADGGVDLDTIASVSQAVSAALDAAETDATHPDVARLLGAGPYLLEVSSRGVDRPLTAPRHWRRNIGRMAECRLADGQTVTGRIMDSDDAAAEIDVNGDRRRVEFADVGQATIRVELSRPKGQPGGASSPALSVDAADDLEDG
jgi:ribosome maturation factor RimP